MRTQLGFEREGFGTEAAVESGPDLEMSPHMGVQIAGTVERFPAFCTDKWLFLKKRQLMYSGSDSELKVLEKLCSDS